MTAMRGSDEEAGLDFLKQIETNHIEQDKDPDFSPGLAATFLPVVMNHQKSLRRIEESLERLNE